MSCHLNRHNAPPVVYPLERLPFLGGLLLGLWLAGLCTVLLWWRAMQQFDARVALAIFFVLVAGLAARSSWKRLPTGQLAWDGEVWHWESLGYQTGAAEQKLSVVADFQHRMLLRLENQAGASLWLWLEINSMPERWLDIRRAVFSPHKLSAAVPRPDSLSEQSAAAGPGEVMSACLTRAAPASRKKQ